MYEYNLELESIRKINIILIHVSSVKDFPGGG